MCTLAGVESQWFMSGSGACQPTTKMGKQRKKLNATKRTHMHMLILEAVYAGMSFAFSSCPCTQVYLPPAGEAVVVVVILSLQHAFTNF